MAKFSGISREAADILTDVVGDTEYDATVPAEDATVAEGETSENVMEDQADLDLDNKDGGEYDATEDPDVTTTEDGDAVDVVDDAFDAVSENTSEDDVIGGGDTGTDVPEETDPAATDVPPAESTDTSDVPEETDPAATDVPVESTDTDSELNEEQIETGAASVESFFVALDRRAVRSFEDGEESILDEPEVKDADIPVADSVTDDTTAGTDEVVVDNGTDNTVAETDDTLTGTDVPEETDSVADETVGEESFFNLF